MLCGEDEYPTSDTSVKLHMVTDNQEEASIFCNQLSTKLVNEQKHAKKVCVVESFSGFQSEAGAQCARLQLVHDTICS